MSGLRAVARHLQAARTIDVLIVGGAAGVLSRELPANHVTEDVDVVHLRPNGAVEELLSAAAKAREDLQLPLNWLSIDAGLYAHELPAGAWRRRILIADLGTLRVFALSRRDFIAAKFVAHRTVDREHLRLMRVTPAERRFVLRHLGSLRKRLPVTEHSKLEVAEHFVRNWTVEQ